MKWISQDIDMYLQSKEYVDTVVIPLLPVSFSQDMKQTAAMSEFITLLSVQLERQFRGRLLMLPGYSYRKSAPMDKLQEDLRDWETELAANGFKYVFYVTSDSSWKANEIELGGNLIWLPTIPLEHLDQQSKNSIFEDQVKQLMNLFIQKWKEN